MDSSPVKTNGDPGLGVNSGTPTGSSTNTNMNGSQNSTTAANSSSATSNLSTPVATSTASVTTTTASNSSHTGGLSPHPVIDTLAILGVLNVLPTLASAALLFGYILIRQSSHLVGSTLSFLFKHDLKKFGADRDSSFSYYHRSSFRKRLVAIIGSIFFDFIISLVLLMINPRCLDYTHLLSKSFIAVNLASSRNKYFSHAIYATVIFLMIESFTRYAIKQLPLTSTTFLFDHLQAYNSVPKRPISLLWYYISIVRFQHVGSSFDVEHFIEIIHSTLAIYTIMHNIIPVLRKFAFVNSLTESIDTFTTISLPYHLNVAENTEREDTTNDTSPAKSKTSSNGKNNNFKNINKTSPPTSRFYSRKSNELKTIKVPREVAKSQLPSYVLESTPPSSAPLSEIEDEGDSETANRKGNNSGTNTTAATTSSNDLTNDKREFDEFTPASFPKDRQISNINDISSSTLVVAQNFENFCANVLFPTKTSSITKLSSSSSGTLLASSSSSSLKFQQPIWAFFAAAKTMFSRQDLYSGEYYQHNALVSTRDDDQFKRSYVDCIQCFAWVIGETYVGFELYGAYINQILVRVNGVIWDQVSSGRVNEQEIVVVTGLSPLSQYDIEFVNVNELFERELLANTTVSTIQENMTLTEAKPSDPIQTLQTSLITAAEAVKNERYKQKKLKLDSRTKKQSLKSEIDTLNNKGASNDDSRNYKKLSSLKQAVDKFEEENDKVEAQIQEVYNLETQIEERYIREKMVYEQEMVKLLKIENDHNSKINEQKKKISTIESDISQLTLKKEKLLNRKAKLEADISKLNQEIEKLKKTDMDYKNEQRKIRKNLRKEKFKILESDINKFEDTYNNQVTALQQQGLLSTNDLPDGANLSNSSSALHINIQPR